MVLPATSRIAPAHQSGERDSEKTIQPRAAVNMKLADVLMILTLVAEEPLASAAVKRPHIIAFARRFNPKNIARTTKSIAFEFSDSESNFESVADSVDVSVVVTSFANMPLVAAARPLHMASATQPGVIVIVLEGG